MSMKNPVCVDVESMHSHDYGDIAIAVPGPALYMNFAYAD
jgi:hypothetical protein